MERSPALPRKPVHARQGRRDITPLTEREILPTQGYCGVRQRVPPAAIMITMQFSLQGNVQNLMFWKNHSRQKKWPKGLPCCGLSGPQTGFATCSLLLGEAKVKV